jgi:hypothetical protein
LLLAAGFVLMRDLQNHHPRHKNTFQGIYPFFDNLSPAPDDTAAATSMRNPSAVHSRKGSEKYETSSNSRGFFWRYVKKKKKKWWWYLLQQQQQQQAPAPTLADTATSSFLFCWNDQSSRDCSFFPPASAVPASTL